MGYRFAGADVWARENVEKKTIRRKTVLKIRMAEMLAQRLDRDG
jgi:hypothetical protein